MVHSGLSRQLGQLVCLHDDGPLPRGNAPLPANSGNSYALIMMHSFLEVVRACVRATACMCGVCVCGVFKRVLACACVCVTPNILILYPQLNAGACKAYVPSSMRACVRPMFPAQCARVYKAYVTTSMRVCVTLDITSPTSRPFEHSRTPPHHAQTHTCACAVASPLRRLLW